MSMSLDYEANGFTGVLLAAMPGVQDPTFGRSVVLICAHSPDGAMGLIVNVISEVTAPLSDNSDIVHVLSNQKRLHFGGPAERSRPFVLHSTDWDEGAETLRINEYHSITATPDALSAVASGRGPARALVALGYSAWGPGQLENEVLRNTWLSGAADPEITFTDDNSAKWRRALASMGASPEALSGAVGRA